MNVNTRKDPRRLPGVLVAALLLLPLASPAIGSDATSGESKKYKLRYERERLDRSEVPSPPAAVVPRELVLKHVDGEEPEALPSREPGRIADRGKTGPAAVTRGSGGTARVEGGSVVWHGAALQAARWAALEVSQIAGRREYYRIGAYEGMSSALRDPAIGAWDFRQGLRVGRHDPEALRLGGSSGTFAAEDLARIDAEQRVSGQFLDLSHRPRFAPRIEIPRYAPETVWAAPVELSEVFLDFPVLDHGPRRLARTFEAWRVDPWTVYGFSSWRKFHDARWADPDRAFALWSSDRRRAAVYRRLTPEDRRRFEGRFKRAFLRRLPDFFEQYTARAYEHGFVDGWSYGAFVRREWRFRVGYNEGFDQAAASSALASFQAVYPTLYTRVYRELFDDWSQNPKPGILAVTLTDAGDDGIFEPGEEVLAQFELANYGGRAGSFAIGLDGVVLERDTVRSVEIPARSVLSGRTPLRGAIDPGTPARTRATLGFRIAGLREELGLLVSYPLEFAGGARLVGLDVLGGRATLAAEVVNRSRRPKHGRVDLVRGDRFRIVRSGQLGELPSGASRSVEFELGGMRSLDLLAGGIEATLQVAGRGAVNDRTRFRFPDLSVDLNNRALLDFMVALARDERAPAGDVAAARRLLLRRLQADWRAAVHAAGNPYKRDLRNNAAGTALGELVQTYRRERGGLRNPEVFSGLNAAVAALAERLPGPHPFLRRHMKRLARKLG